MTANTVDIKMQTTINTQCHQVSRKGFCMRESFVVRRVITSPNQTDVQRADTCCW